MKLLLHGFSPAGPRARLSILIFHRVLPQADPLSPDEPDAARFDERCAWVRRAFNVLPLAEAWRRLGEGTLPARAAAITFDDGYADNHDVALPILQRHGLPATFFIATGFIDGGRMWNDTLIESVRGCARDELDLDALALPGLGRLPLRDVADRRRAVDQLIRALRYLPAPERQRAVDAVALRSGASLPSDLMMSSQQVQALHRAGMDIGGHTVNHPILARLPDDEARREILGGKQWLESLLQAPLRVFAYPNGRPDEDYRVAHARMVREAGFEMAVSTAWGAARRGTDAFQVPRFTPWDRTRWRFDLRMLRNLAAPVRLAAS